MNVVRCSDVSSYLNRIQYPNQHHQNHVDLYPSHRRLMNEIRQDTILAITNFVHLVVIS